MNTSMKKVDCYNVVLAEDNTEHQKLISKMLKKYNINLEVVDNGKELLYNLDHGRKYDLVLMDIQMPIMDGYAATDAIRKNPKYSDLVIIGLTAFAMEGDEQVALRRGMNDYITKPIDRQILHHALSRYLVLK